MVVLRNHWLPHFHAFIFLQCILFLAFSCLWQFSRPLNGSMKFSKHHLILGFHRVYPHCSRLGLCWKWMQGTPFLHKRKGYFIGHSLKFKVCKTYLWKTGRKLNAICFLNDQRLSEQAALISQLISIWQSQGRITPPLKPQESFVWVYTWHCFLFV